MLELAWSFSSVFGQKERKKHQTIMNLWFKESCLKKERSKTLVKFGSQALCLLQVGSWDWTKTSIKHPSIFERKRRETFFLNLKYIMHEISFLLNQGFNDYIQAQPHHQQSILSVGVSDSIPSTNMERNQNNFFHVTRSRVVPRGSYIVGV